MVVVVSPTTLPAPPAFDAATIAAIAQQLLDRKQGVLATRVDAAKAEALIKQHLSLMDIAGTENPADIRNELGMSMEAGVGIYRTEELMQGTIDKINDIPPKMLKVVEQMEGVVSRVEAIVGLAETIVSPITATESAVREVFKALRSRIR